MQRDSREHKDKNKVTIGVGDLIFDKMLSQFHVGGLGNGKK